MGRVHRSLQRRFEILREELHIQKSWADMDLVDLWISKIEELNRTHSGEELLQPIYDAIRTDADMALLDSFTICHQPALDHVLAVASDFEVDIPGAHARRLIPAHDPLTGELLDEGIPAEDPVLERIRELRAELKEAEEDLLSWIRGEYSSFNEQSALESSEDDRGATLIRTAQQNAAQIDLATSRVRGLKLLIELNAPKD